MTPKRYSKDLGSKNQEGILRSEEDFHFNLNLFDASQISVSTYHINIYEL